ncbi:DUF1878 domain-containing protein [Clostridium perfringens]|uniref:DUF1878 domain-containing protein n=1 Tax=Clostridium perfringens TaxID=1502 RepID=UPI00111D2A03|nr:DUF1878 domain-containing protein [Clostridium perfringens]TPE21323.1 DUF1878 domain-containing protein [Clostridium perfringens]
MDNDFNTINQRLDFLEFRQDLLFENTNVSRFLFETKTNKKEYEAIMDLMDEFRNKIDNGEKVSHASFEQKIYNIIGNQGDYHFCEGIAKAFMEDDRWAEVFINLYGNMDKYKSYIKDYLNE